METVIDFQIFLIVSKEGDQMGQDDYLFMEMYFRVR